MAERSPDDRIAFLGEFCEKIGIDESMLSAMFPQGPPTAPAPAAAPGGFNLNLPDT